MLTPVDSRPTRTGSVLGIAISTSILQQSLKDNLSHFFSGKHGDKIIRRIRENVDTIRDLQGNEKAAAIQAYASSMHNVFIAIAIAAALAVSIAEVTHLAHFVAYAKGTMCTVRELALHQAASSTWQEVVG